MEKNIIHITAIHLSSKTKATQNYTLWRKDRGNDIKGRGLTFQIHESIIYQKVPTPPSLVGDKHLELLTIQVDNNFTSAVYMSRPSSPPEAVTPDSFIYFFVTHFYRHRRIKLYHN